MKTIVCVEPGRFEMREQDERAPGPGEALVRIRRVGICGTDYHAFRGNQPFFEYPRILGHELSGVVEALGEGTAGVAVGDRVAVVPYLECGVCIACRQGKPNCCTSLRVLGVHTDGGMRERLNVPADHLLAVNDLTLDQAATLEPLAIGAHAVRRSGLTAGETALVIGGGPIGLGVMAFAKAEGANVIAMEVSDERLALCAGWAKADYLVHAKREPADRIAELTGGDYPTVVFDATGNAQSMADAFRYVAHGGRLVYVGLVKSDIAFHDPEFHKRELTLMGSRNATKEDFARVMEAVRRGRIDAAGYITHRAPFADMIGEFERWLRPESKVVKAIVELQ
ncbi:dehydrogenase [Paenibacillus cisolokensis]|uniref:Dehydrogenase n=1 Tax=Paenibacillus cisolokensis TaxID=1658519 RepID=A0ABQ4N6Y7_9BACL|nr:zinc-binding alcohol dehydrogenase family protein [Paenibacillus cisolokensis]GIQ63998.1 dehydrogenase [Paenibacillus cisolokensis]